jgi:hypothetical protein
MAKAMNSAYDLKLQVDKHEERITSVEKCVAVNSERINTLEECSDELRNDMKEMREVLISSKLAIKIGTWIVAGFGISVIALIWSMITGQASILFK